MWAWLLDKKENYTSVTTKKLFEFQQIDKSHVLREYLDDVVKMSLLRWFMNAPIKQVRITISNIICVLRRLILVATEQVCLREICFLGVCAVRFLFFSSSGVNCSIRYTVVSSIWNEGPLKGTEDRWHLHWRRRFRRFKHDALRKWKYIPNINYQIISQPVPISGRSTWIDPLFICTLVIYII